MIDFTTIADGEVDLALRQSGSTEPASAPRPLGFSPVFFPGTAKAEDAETIRLGYGEERSGVDFVLGPVPVSRLDGVVLDADRQPIAAASVALRPTGPETATTMLPFVRGGSLYVRETDGMGHFAFEGVPPGEYVATARPSVAAGGRDASDSEPFYARTNVSLDGGDRSISLVWRATLVVSGRVAFEGLARPEDVAGVTVTLTAADAPAGSEPDVHSASMAADGTFAIRGLTPGTYRASARAFGANGPSEWLAKSGQQGGRDLLDAPLELSADGGLSDAVILFTDHPTGLSGRLQTSAGTPTSDYYVIAFAVDERYWFAFSRRLAAMRPDSTGTFRCDLPAGDWFDSGFLRELLAASPVRVRLREGERAVQNLQIAR